MGTRFVARSRLHTVIYESRITLRYRQIGYLGRRRGQGKMVDLVFFSGFLKRQRTCGPEHQLSKLL